MKTQMKSDAIIIFVIQFVTLILISYDGDPQNDHS